MTAAMACPYIYSLFGLTLSSVLELPELLPAGPGEDPDVVIVMGDVESAKGADQTPRRIDGGSAIEIQGVARFAIIGGNRITVDPAKGAAARNVRLFLLGSAMGMLLHQRGLLPLHANTVEIEGRAVAFMGHSGAGKSTLAAWFHDQGRRILNDDVSVVRFDEEGHAKISQGIPRFRLWREAIEASGRVPHDYDYSYAGEPGYDKFDVPIDHELLAECGLDLAVIYMLERGDELAIDRLGPTDSIEALFANTYRGAYLDFTEMREQHWRSCINLAARVPVFRLARPWKIDALDHLARRIAEHAVSCAI